MTVTEQSPVPLRSDCDGLEAPQVLARISGLTYRRLDYWTRTRRLRPHTRGSDSSGSGIPFCWPLDQVEIAARMFRLTNMGFSVEAATDLARSQELLQVALIALAREVR